MRVSNCIALVALAVSTCAGFSAAANCDVDPDRLGARYTIERISVDGLSRRTTQFTFTLWRDGDRIAHELPETGVVEVWHRGVQANVRLVRQFDETRSGIVFFSEDLAVVDPGLLWESKRHVIPASLLGLSSSGDVACDFTESVKRRRVAAKLTATWRPASALVESYHRVTQRGEVRMTLKDVITDSRKVSEFFDDRRGYELIDWADVGDREGDPLVAGMLATGGIPHDVAGFTERVAVHRH